MKSVRSTLCLILLALLLISTSACSSGTALTRDSIHAQLEKGDSAWAQAFAAPYRKELSQFADAPINRQHLAYDPSSRKLTGSAEILFTNGNDRPLDTLYLRTRAKWWNSGSDAFTMTNVKVDGKPVKFTVGKTLITVPLAAPLQPGKSAVITYDATVLLPKLVLNQGAKRTLTTNVGFYGAGYDFTGVGGFPMVVPKGDEGKEFDELPEDRETDNGELALEEYWVTIPQDWSVIALGAVVDETAAKDGKKTVHTAGMGGGGATFMFITNSAVKRTQKVGATELNTYVPASHEKYADSLMKNAADALQVYEKAFGPMPLPKLDVLALPLLGVGGAYMNGVFALNTSYLTDYRSTAPTSTPPALKPLFENDNARLIRKVIFHEVAHAYWGQLVSPDAETLPWFHEALAEASTYMAIDQLDGVAAGDWWRTKDAFSYQKQRILGMPDAPLTLPMEQYKDMQQRTTLTYYKGGLFYDALRKHVGDEKFGSAMRAYISEHALDIVSDRGPVEALMKEPGVEALYRRWVEEAHGDEDIGVFELHDNALRKTLGLPPE